MIHIDMDMPKSCFECDKTYKWKKDGKVQCPHINMPSISSNRDCRPSYCPLKEVPTGHCKDCKWWKDKDGVYRRGIGVESKCPINRREVMEGMGYCFMFEPQESEDKE